MTEGMEKPKILIVDDAPGNIHLLIAILAADYEIAVATDGQNALQATAECKPDLILLDIEMPELDGYAVCARLKADPVTQEIPILFLTARDSGQDEAKGLLLGAIDYITKPFNPTVVTARVKNQVELKRRRDAMEQMATDLRVAKEAAAKERDFTREIVNALPGTFYLLNQEGRFQLWNKKLEEVTGYTPEEIAVASPADFFQGREQAAVAERLQEVFTQGYAVAEASVVAKDGTLTPHYFVGQRIDLDGVSYLIGMGLDISERKRMESALREAKEQAEAATKAKGEFLATMSHEIRTPMNAVMGLTDLALQTVVSPKTRDYLTKIAQASRSLLHIINDILDFSKMESGRLQLEHVDFLLRDLFDHLADLFRHKSTTKGIELILQAGSGYRYALTGDGLRLEQILMNLISNAIKFTEKGEVEVGVRLVAQQGARAVLAFFVRDTGIGLSQAQIDTLFAPFVQADGSTTRKYGGTGLGLSICRRLVELMGGTIGVESQPGVGSVFRFTVLLTCRATTEQDNMTLPEDMQALPVLVVDDNAVVRTALQTLLDVFGFATTTVGSGPEALAAIQQGWLANKPCQLALVDGLMPRMDGLETVRRMLELTAPDTTQETPLPKIILMTDGNREKGIAQQAKALGIRALLPKPIHCALLFDTIMELFSKGVSRVHRPDREVTDLACVTSQIGGARVLLVEDNAINQLVAREMLEQVGLVVTVAGDGLAATRMVLETPFDLVLMDIQMPLMDGYTACRQIRSNPLCAQLPIIAMTAHATNGDREHCLDAGMVDHITKPIDRKHLYATLLAWIKPGDRPPVPPVPTRHGLPHVAEPGQVPALLPGIDVANGLDRLGDNHQVYRFLLLEFRKNFAKTAEKVRLALREARQDDIQAAQYLIHAIKGMAGNLSARALFQAAVALEKAIKEDRRADWPLLLDTFAAALQQVVDAIGTLQPAADTTPSEHGRRLDIADIMPRLITLADAIQKHRADAVACCQTLEPLFKGTSVEHTWEQLDRSLDDYKFKEAQGHLDALCNALDIPLPWVRKS
ncbi:MAG: response regulator [Magnetococcales bacterium]|nr:response regulator [Magnetococcales bacterium]